MFRNFLCIVSVYNSYRCNLWWHNNLNFLWGKHLSSGSFLFAGNYTVCHFLMVYFVEYLYYVRLFMFWCWACKSNLISGCFCWRFCGIYALLENAFWLAAKRTYQFLFWLPYYKVGWTIKCFFVVSFLWLNLEMLDHDNSAFLSIHSLRGTVHTFIRK